MSHVPLNDVEFSAHISSVHIEDAKLNKLVAEKKYDALTDALANIEDAARKANWFIQRNTK